MTKLHLDFETRSIISLPDCGLDRYVKDSSTKVLLLGWAFDEDDPQIWEPRNGPMLKEVCEALHSDCKIAAWNSSFERLILAEVLGIRIPYERFEDPSTYARHISLPGKLQDVSDILGLDDQGKDTEGKRLIKLFCEPVSLGGEITLFEVTEPYFREPEKHPEDWEKFRQYCKQDVVAERRIMEELAPFVLPPLEKKIWYLDQKINDAGLPVNREFVKKALTLAERSKEELGVQLKEKTGLENPNSRDQMLKWLGTQNYTYNSIEKATVAAALKGTRISQLARDVLITRKEAAKTSYKKFEAILGRLSDDDRLRYQYLYLGAARSGRWSGGGVQVQNLARPTKEVGKNLEKILNQINTLDYDGIKAEHASVITAVISCVRSVFQAPEGKTIVVCDLNAIENRVLGWMAGCDAILKVFRDGYDPYLDFAAKMYNCRYEDLADMSVIPHKPKNEDAVAKRQIAKSGILGCGYSLGPGVEKVCKQCGRRFGFKPYCKKCKCTEFTFDIILVKNKYGDMVKTGLIGYAEGMGVTMTPAQAYHTWYCFRQSYPEVVQLWKNLEKAAMQVLREGGSVQVGVVSFDTVQKADGNFVLRMHLPSSRCLHYWNAKITTRYFTGRDGEPYERDAIEYEGIGHGVGMATEEEGGKGTNFGPCFLHPGKICENGDQAISRDAFANGLLLADEMGAEIIGHSHDEALVLADNDPLGFGLDDLKYCMSQTPFWAEGLPLAADGFSSRVYRKG